MLTNDRYKRTCLKQLPVVQSFTMSLFMLQIYYLNHNKLQIQLRSRSQNYDINFARQKVSYFIIVTLFFLSFSDRNKIPPTTPRVKFPDRLVLKGN